MLQVEGKAERGWLEAFAVHGIQRSPYFVKDETLNQLAVLHVNGSPATAQFAERFCANLGGH